MKRPIDHAKQACATMMRKFNAADLPPKGRFHYHQGVFLSGMHKTYEIVKDEALMKYIKDWVDCTIDDEGYVLIQRGIQMDDMQPGILLYPLLDKYGDEKYRKAISFLMGQFAIYPRCECGGIWHKDIYPFQMWLDGLYMGGPINAEYGKRFNRPEAFDFVLEQAQLMRKYTEDEKTGLWYHAWDESKKVGWANPETGKSAEFWGRSIGWVPVALLDDLDFIPKSHKGYNEIAKIAVDLLNAVAKFQDDKTGLWYQVVDKPNGEGNWLETSCSSLFVAGICKAVRLGLMDESALAIAKKGYEGVIASLEYQGEDVLIGNVCIGTGVGDYTHYINRPTSVNDLHGVGAYLLMCAEVEMVFDKFK
ncbi:MAG: glycoside hydrolase family 88 protein [Defluviitaleaceae bacterium]|nr:glycoside hydrolase family 88 protein [Defluviitaleaceae bacterium]